MPAASSHTPYRFPFDIAECLETSRKPRSELSLIPRPPRRRRRRGGADSRGICWGRGGGGESQVKLRFLKKTANKLNPGHSAEVELLNCVRNGKCLSLVPATSCIVIVKAFTLQLARTKASEVATGFSCYDRCGVSWG